MEYHSTNKEEPTVNTQKNLDDSPGNYAKWKMQIPKGYFMSPCM